METSSYSKYKCVAGIRGSPYIICRRQIEKCIHWDFHRSSCGRSIDIEIFRFQFEHGLCQASITQRSALPFREIAFFCVRVNSEIKVRQMSVKIACDDRAALPIRFNVFFYCIQSHIHSISWTIAREWPNGIVPISPKHNTRICDAKIRSEKDVAVKSELHGSSYAWRAENDNRLSICTFRRSHIVRTKPTRLSIIQIASVHLLESEQKKQQQANDNSKFKERTNTYAAKWQSTSHFIRIYCFIHREREMIFIETVFTAWELSDIEIKWISRVNISV